jgi:hypothetical protein
LHYACINRLIENADTSRISREVLIRKGIDQCEKIGFHSSYFLSIAITPLCFNKNLLLLARPTVKQKDLLVSVDVTFRIALKLRWKNWAYRQSHATEQENICCCIDIRE